MRSPVLKLTACPSMLVDIPTSVHVQCIPGAVTQYKNSEHGSSFWSSVTQWHFLLSWCCTSSTFRSCTCRTSSSVAPLPGVGLGAVDIQETPNAYLFKVDVPGLSKDDVKGARFGRLLCWVGPCTLALS